MAEYPLRRPFLPPDYGEKINFEDIARNDVDFADAIKDTRGFFDFKNAAHFLYVELFAVLRRGDRKIWNHFDKMRCVSLNLSWFWASYGVPQIGHRTLTDFH